MKTRYPVGNPARPWAWLALWILLTPGWAPALERPGVEFKIFQFPSDQIPRIDGNASDWAMVPESYLVGSDELWDSSRKHAAPDAANLDVRVRVGWVRGLNRLYFLYETHDDYWDFALPGLKNDTFEVVVDGDLSGGPLIDRFRHNPEVVSAEEAYFSMHGVHAQNYHIFTPAEGKDWAMFWGPAQWAKALPYANAASRHTFRPGEAGRLTLEFWITPFDHASPDGPERSVETTLRENALIGLSWAVIDYDNVDSRRNNGFWHLSRSHTMFGQANELVAFRLMPLEPALRPPLDVRWSHRIVDMDRRLVAFKDETVGRVTSWHWDFGDGETSTEQYPLHTYKEGGRYVVVLTVGGPDGAGRLSKIWDVAVR